MNKNTIDHNLFDEETAEELFQLAIEFSYKSIAEPSDETVLSFIGFLLYSKMRYRKLSLH